ncbi:family 10 glycosylhydrolase [Chakrabartyella piscis]|uniref:family 10 glycosylhydrolase n=1 Tax=Chakrabartyella piscis TaxID=2918914 RepID=UPI0029584E79|nr:family 10 glycosylhydrolase [Chakrabartyella piscis]
MKQWIRNIGTLTLTISLMGALIPTTALAYDSTDFRGAWISTVYSADFPSTINDATAQKAEFTEKIDALQDLGINAVVVQVRPKSDAFYDSDINPWSSVLTGEQGKYPGYDPMEYMIEEAHDRGMEFHAWLNPYRITTSGTDLSTLSSDHPALAHPEWILTYNNALYYDPSQKAVQEYIAETVAEIVENYDVDAIHFDDYFYPSNYPLPDGEDRDGSVANQRREDINDMVELVSKTIKSIDSSVEFGISPMGVWKNSSSDSNGSDTRGSEGYYTVFADATTWIANEWIDYIAPQIYWEQDNQYAPYEPLVSWWSDVVSGTDVTLYIGQGIYKDIVSQEITEQMNINENYNVDGSIFFSSRDLLDNREGVGTAVKAYYASNTSSNTVVTPEVETPQVEVPEILTPEPETTSPTIIEKKTAYARSYPVSINGSSVSFETYNINDYSYFKLRDIASALLGTNKQFTTIWDEANTAIHLVTEQAYDGTLSVSGSSTTDSIAITSTAKLYVDGIEKTVSAYTINDYTYYKLRDIAQILNFAVEWDEDTLSTNLNTNATY